MIEEQKSAFQSRVERINARAEEASKGTSRRSGDTIWHRLSYPISFIGAFLLGVGAVFLSRYIQFQMIGVPGDPKAGSQDLISIVLAMAAIFLISFLLNGRQKEFARTSALAMMATTFTFHNAVWAYPDSFEQVYGPDWVEMVKKQTEPSSIRLFSIVIAFD